MTMLAVPETDEKISRPLPHPAWRGNRSPSCSVWWPLSTWRCSTRYGWHRDEFYYVISGRHLAWGYPDQPPLTPVLARMLAVGGLTGVRLGALAAHLGCMVAAAALAAEIGGRRRAQVLTAAAVAACPMFTGASLLFGTTVMDQLFWVLILLLVARALRRSTPWAWLAAGAVAGVGLEDKQTVLVLLAGIAVGLAVTRRRRAALPVAVGGRGPRLRHLASQPDLGRHPRMAQHQDGIRPLEPVRRPAGPRPSPSRWWPWSSSARSSCRCGGRVPAGWPPARRARIDGCCSPLWSRWWCSPHQAASSTTRLPPCTPCSPPAPSPSRSGRQGGGCAGTGGRWPWP